MKRKLVSETMMTMLLLIPIWYTMLVPSIAASGIEEIDVIEHFRGTFGKEGFILPRAIYGVWELPILRTRHVYVEKVIEDNIILRMDVNTIRKDTGETLPELSGNSTYVINKFTLENVMDAPEADKPREGYDPFYQSHLKPGEDIPNAWLDNLNETGTLEFVRAVEIEGVELYEYFINKTITKELVIPDWGDSPEYPGNYTLTSTKTILIQPLLGGLPVHTKNETFIMVKNWFDEFYNVWRSLPIIYVTYRTAVPGDVNGDGIVDIHDIVTAALAFGSYPGHPRWNPDADVYEDGIIDIFDLVTIAVNYGKRW